MLEQDDHADVSFKFSDGTSVRAHRAILSIRSPVVYCYYLFFNFFFINFQVFAAMFAHQTTEARDGRVQIEDIPVAVFKLLLSYIYTAKVFFYNLLKITF
jgi:hypothetical protein